MDSQTSFRMETSEVSRNAGCFLRIEDSLRGRRDRSREAGKFWMSGCEDVGKAARMVTSPPKLSKAQKQLRKLCTLARGGQFEPTTNSTQHTTFPPGYATWPQYSEGSCACQPEVDVFRSWAMLLPTVSGKSSL